MDCRWNLVLATLLPSSLAVVTTGAASAHHAEQCQGRAATHVNADGSGGDDVIVITDSGADVHAWAGNDVICLRTGSARYAGATVRADAGNDTIITESGYNTVYGGPDDDSILSNSHDHLLDGEDGNDHIYIGTVADDVVYGGDGADMIFGSAGNDTAHAGGGNDLMYGFGGDDELHGAGGNDEVHGGPGSDQLDGGGDTDHCLDQTPAGVFVSCESVTITPAAPGAIVFG